MASGAGLVPWTWQIVTYFKLVEYLFETEAGSAFSIASFQDGSILAKVELLSLLAGWQQVV